MPEYTIKVNQEDRPKGDAVNLAPLGIIANGDSVKVELDADQASYIDNAYGVSVLTEGGKAVKKLPDDFVADSDFISRLPRLREVATNPDKILEDAELVEGGENE